MSGKPSANYIYKFKISILASISYITIGCTTMPLHEAGTLSSYDNIGPAEGKLFKQRVYVDGDGLSRMKTVSIIPTTYTIDAASHITLEADRSLVSNALDRALCIALSERYQMVPNGQPVDLTIRSVITDITPTDKAMAGLATVISTGSSFIIPGDIPFLSVPRLPIGLGGLSVEAEAIDHTAAQRAAIVWARGANSFQNKPRYSEVGDAYTLSTKFAGDFSQILITGKKAAAIDLSLPSKVQMQSWLGGKPKYPACEYFGRAPGLPGMIAGRLGLPPQWTDESPYIPIAENSDQENLANARSTKVLVTQ
ncbi:DUF3313 domain-containing protein [Aquamicrobium segne]|uniref:DUF3313 domain-containing protein n=1 Tax=Aquamicrobium segne TaxID=469547 RepID=A0ABW0GZK2_9HYPH